MTRFAAYYRVSTDKQGRSGLGLEAQRAAVDRYVSGIGGAVIVTAFIEVESGRRNDRPELVKALAACRTHRATLVIAKLDRLARNVAFIAGLMETGVPFLACDMPTATPFMLHIYAAMAEAEGKAISARTKAALAAAKTRGVKLGNPALRAGTADMARAANAVKTARANARAADLAGTLTAIRRAGVTSLEGIATALNARGIPPPSGRGAWYPTTVARVEARARQRTG